LEQDLNKNYYDWLNKIQNFREYGVFFIMGAPKSGTTWIQKCLNLHPQIASDGEGHFDLLGEFIQQFMLAFNKEQEGRISRAHNPRTITFDDTDFHNILKSIIDNQMAKRIIHEDIKWVGDKTPEHTKYLNILKQLYPSSKVIHIIRDGRDCLVSWWVGHKNRESSPTNDIKNHIEWFVKKIWVPYVRVLRGFGKKHPEDYIEITYEEMHTDPHKILKYLFNRLPVGYTDLTIDYCVRNSRFQTFTKGRVRGQEDASSHFRKGIIGDWKNYLNDHLHDRFLDFGGELLQELGYEL
jgi:hypothetical protein